MNIYRIFAPNINKLLLKHDIEGLIRSLKNKRVRERACTALINGEGGILDIPGVVDTLSAVLNDKDSWVRFVAIKALKKAEAAEQLIVALKDQNSHNVWEAQKALHNIGVKALKPLIAAQQDESVNIRRSVIEIMGNIGDVGAVASLIDTLQDKDPEIRWLAAEALGKIGDDRAVKPLIAALRDTGTYTIHDLDSNKPIPRFVRKEAAFALAKVRNGLQALKELAQSEPDVNIRVMVKDVLDCYVDRRK